MPSPRLVRSRRRGAPPQPRRLPVGRLRSHRDFLSLWGGESISELGSQVSALALPIVAVKTVHASTFDVGVLTGATTVAFLLVGLPAGVWVDRLPRRKVMIVADLGRVLAFASIPLTAGFGALDILQLYLVALASGVCTVFFDVAYQSYVPSLVGLEAVVEANAKLTGTAQLAQVAGPSVAGGLIQAVGAATAVAFDAASFACSAFAVGAIRAKEVPVSTRGTRRSLVAEVREGLGFVGGHRILRAIAATTGTFNFFSAITNAIEVVFLVRALRTPPGIVGLMFAAIGVGGVIGALFASPFARRIGGARATLVGACLSLGGLLVPLTERGSGLLWFACGYGVTATGAVIYNVNQVSFRQRLCPPQLLGRMNATMRFVVWGTLPLGALLGGALGSELGLRPTLWIAAAGQVAAALFLFASPLRSLRDFPEPVAT